MGAVPLAALSAYLAARPVLPPRSIRLWAAAAYALLPAVVGAAPAGRIGTAVVAVVLPPAVWSAARALGLPGRPGSTSVAFLAGLLLAVLTAFAPVCYLMALALGLVAAAARVRLPRRRDLLRLLPVLGLAPLLLAPWLPAIWDEPDLLLREPGLAGPGLVDARLSPLDVLLVHPGGPGMYPLLVTVPLLLAALAALLRRRDRAVVWAGWAAALVGMAAAVLMSRARFTAPPAVGPVSGWPGPATLVAGAGLVLAAAAGAVGARSRIAAMSFGWRQPSAVVLTVVSALVPVVAGAWWAVAGADRPLHRGDSAVLPAFVAAEAVRGGRPRTLVLRSEGSGRLAYSLLRAQEPAIGQADTVTNGGPSTGLSRAVSDLASGRGGDAAGELLPYGVRYVLMPRPVDAALAAAVDAVPGLLPVSAPDGSRVWTLAFRSGRLRLLGPTAADPLKRLRDSRLVSGGVVGADARIPPGPPGRVLLVSEASSSGWRAQLDGRSLTPGRYDGWAQTFRVPPAGGHLVLGFDDTGHQRLLWFQLGAVLLAVVLALPRARRGDDHDPLEERSS
jgi:hypothetical protein